MEPELLLDQGVPLGPIFMDQDRLVQAEREHLRLEVHNLATVLQVQVPIKRQNIHQQHGNFLFYHFYGPYFVKSGEKEISDDFSKLCRLLT